MLTVRIALFSSAGLLCFAAIAPACRGAEGELIVRVAWGRQFHGTIGSGSTAEQLVLRTNSDGITLSRPIRWDVIREAKVDGQEVEAAKLRDMAASRSRESGVGSRESGAGSRESGAGSRES